MILSGIISNQLFQIMNPNSKLEKAKAIEAFLSARTVAFVGVSRDKRKFSFLAYDKVRKCNWNLIPVNPAVDFIDGQKCYASILEIPSEIDAVISMVPKSQTKGIIEQAKQRNIKNIWIQQKSESPEALKFALENQMIVISGECIMMFVDPVDSVHKFHRWLNKVFGKYPLHKN